jgi:hypothetical protein
MGRNHSSHANASGTKTKYFVDVSGEEKERPERKKFQNRDDALAYAERQAARKRRVRVTDFNRKEIFSSQ